MVPVANTQLANFANDFLTRVGNRGFGAMTKNDFEVLLFDLFRTYSFQGQSKSNHDWSILLRIPETKVRRLAYEADLVYHTYDANLLKNKFFKILLDNVTKFSTDKRKIQFVIEDKSLRTMISADLKSLGYFADSSFNSEVVSVELEAFSALLISYYPDEFKTKWNTEIAKLPKSSKAYSYTYNEIFKIFLVELAKSSGKVLPEIIKDIVEAYTNPSALIKRLINYFS